MIEHSMMCHDVDKNFIMFTWDSHLYGTQKCIESFIFKLEIQMKCKIENKIEQNYQFC